MGKRRKNRPSIQRCSCNAVKPKTVHKPVGWHVYFQRRAIIFLALAITGFLVNHFYGLWFLGKGGEVVVGVIVDRIGGAVIFGEEIGA